MQTQKNIYFESRVYSLNRYSKSIYTKLQNSQQRWVMNLDLDDIIELNEKLLGIDTRTEAGKQEMRELAFDEGNIRRGCYRVNVLFVW